MALTASRLQSYNGLVSNCNSRGVPYPTSQEFEAYLNSTGGDLHTTLEHFYSVPGGYYASMGITPTPTPTPTQQPTTTPDWQQQQQAIQAALAAQGGLQGMAGEGGVTPTPAPTITPDWQQQAQTMENILGFYEQPPAGVSGTPSTATGTIVLVNPTTGEALNVATGDTGTISTLLAQGWMYGAGQGATTSTLGGTYPTGALPTGGTETLGAYSPNEPLGPATPPTPGEYFGYYPGKSDLGWLRKLQAGNMLGYNPAQQWAREQYPNVLANWGLSQAIAGLEGGPQVGWYESPTQWSRDPGLWGRLMGVQGQEMTTDWMQQNPAAIWDIGSAYATGGKRTPFSTWMGAAYPQKHQEWEALHDPSAPDTTGTPWLTKLRQYMGI